MYTDSDYEEIHTVPRNDISRTQFSVSSDHMNVDNRQTTGANQNENAVLTSQNYC